MTAVPGARRRDVRPCAQVAAAAFLSLLAASACGSDDAPAPSAAAGAGGSASQAGGGAGASGATTAGMGGAAGSASGAAGAGGTIFCPEAAPRPQAFLEVVQQGEAASVRAFFPVVTVPDPGTECVHRNEDSCYVETCTKPLPAAPPACVDERTLGASAGTLTLTAGAGTRTLSFDAKAKPPAYPESNGSALFVGGETLTLSAAGGTVPGFQTGLLAPIAIGFPTLSPNLAIKRDQGLAFTWNDSAKAPIVLTFSKTETATSASKETRVICTFTGTALQGKVPAKALVDLPLGPIDFTLTQVSSNVLEAGNWDVTVRAIANQITYGATLD